MNLDLGPAFEMVERTCRECRLPLSVLPLWADVPRADAALQRKVSRYFVHPGCRPERANLLYAGLPGGSWLLVGDGDPRRRYGSCGFCGDRGWLDDGRFCCEGCRSAAT